MALSRIWNAQMKGFRRVQKLHGGGGGGEEAAQHDERGHAGLGVQFQRLNDAHADGAENDGAGKAGSQQQTENDAAHAGSL